jgi:glucose-6-phosphate 1-epimerase
VLGGQNLNINSENIRLTDSNILYGSAEALPCLVVDTPRCSAVVALQGAQLLSFKPTGDRDWLWLSPLATFRPSVAIRGGIPICAPWFGVNRRQTELPKHGFVRNREWQLSAADDLADDLVRLRFKFKSEAEDTAGFPWPIYAELEMYLAEEVSLSLRIGNMGDLPMPLSFAFHSYFAVNDLSQVEIPELAGQQYLDNTDTLRSKFQPAAVRFSGEVDQVYNGIAASQSLCAGDDVIYVTARHCDTAIVWNPGEALAASMSDVGKHFNEYVCLERGMAFQDEQELAAGQEFEGHMSIARTLERGRMMLRGIRAA